MLASTNTSTRLKVNPKPPYFLGEKMPKKPNLEMRNRIIEALKSNGGELSTLEVAEKVGISRAKAMYYLNAMAAEGIVERKWKGRATLIWRLKDEQE